MEGDKRDDSSLVEEKKHIIYTFSVTLNYFKFSADQFLTMCVPRRVIVASALDITGRRTHINCIHFYHERRIRDEVEELEGSD